MRARTSLWFLPLVGALLTAAPIYAQSRVLYRGVEARLLQGHEVTEPNLLSIPTALIVVGNHLVVLEAGGDSVVLVLNRRTGRIEKRMGQHGRMPGGFPAPIGLDSHQDDSFLVLDAVIPEARLYSIRSQIEVGEVDIVAKEVIGIPLEGPVTSAFSDSQQNIVVSGLFPGRRFAWISKSGLIQDFGPVTPGSNEIPLRVRNHAYQTVLVPHRDRTRFAAATLYADRLEIYSVGQPTASARHTATFEPAYRVRRVTNGLAMAVGPNTRYGYVSLTTADNAILALFSGRTHVEAPGRAGFGAIVHVFDWSGQLTKAFVLDRDALVIASDPSGDELYAIVHDPLPMIVRYSLPSAAHPATGTKQP